MGLRRLRRIKRHYAIIASWPSGRSSCPHSWNYRLASKSGMPTNAHVPRRFTAQRHFADRREAIETFVRNLESPQRPEEYRVLVFYGVGGTGKTRLCRELIAETVKRAERSDDIAWAHFDLSIRSTSSAEDLLQLRLALGETGIRFPAFNRAFLRHVKLAKRGASAEQHYPELFHPNLPDANDVLEIAQLFELVPVVGIVAKGIRYAARHIRERMNTRTLTNRDAALLIEIDALDEANLYQSLPKYLGSDIFHHLRSGEAPRRIILFLDTYESLWSASLQGTSRTASSTDDWVQRLAGKAPGILFVVFGRDKLTWNRSDPSWNETSRATVASNAAGSICNDDASRDHSRDIADVSLSQLELEDLTSADADGFLRLVPIQDATIRERIIAAARGNPFFLELQVSVYEAMVNGGMTPTVAAFGGTHVDVLRRFVSHCDRDMMAALRVLAQARTFDERIFTYVRKEFHLQVMFTELLDRSFVAWRSDNNYAIHELLRAHVESDTQVNDRSLWNDIHQSLALYWCSNARVSDVREVTPFARRSLLEAGYHLSLTDPEKFDSWLDQQFEIYFRATAFDELHELLDLQLRLCRDVLRSDRSRLADVHERIGDVLYQLGEFSDTDHHLRAALQNRDANSIGAAQTMKKLGRLMRRRDQLPNAEAMYLEALRIQTKELGTDNLHTACTMHYLGGTLRRQGRLPEAIVLLRRALDTRIKLLGPNDLDVAWSLNDLALSLVNQGDDSDAEEMYRKALVIFDAERGSNHPDSVPTINNLAYFLAESDLEEAERLFRLAVSIRTEKLGEHHHSTAFSETQLAWCLVRQGNVEEAVHLLRHALKVRVHAFGADSPAVAHGKATLASALGKIGQETEAAILFAEALSTYAAHGENSLEIASTSLNVARFLLDRGRPDEARSAIDKAVRIRETKYGFDHPDTAFAYLALADVLDAQRAIDASLTMRKKALVVFEKQQRYSKTAALVRRQIDDSAG